MRSRVRLTWPVRRTPGPLPEVETMIFKALHAYTGEVVRWIEEPGTDGSEVDHPAPVLKLANAPAKDAAATPATGSNAAHLVRCGALDG
ncbi:DUF1775 domain-containing protein [Micromonospora sp. SL4-19]|uniref:DUF1775 domain-containing protein n=1 Tax=Micromonospora sp. SL4-19 TaxID=3399129 RepID=UPI003A4DF67E